MWLCVCGCVCGCAHVGMSGAISAVHSLRRKEGRSVVLGLWQENIVTIIGGDELSRRTSSRHSMCKCLETKRGVDVLMQCVKLLLAMPASPLRGPMWVPGTLFLIQLPAFLRRLQMMPQAFGSLPPAWEMEFWLNFGLAQPGCCNHLGYHQRVYWFLCLSAFQGEKGREREGRKEERKRKEEKRKSCLTVFEEYREKD